MNVDNFKKRLKRENPDLYRFALKRKIKKALKVICIDALAVVLVHLTLSEMHRPEINLGVYTATALFCVLVPLLLPPKGLVFGKSWFGTVEKMQNRNEKWVKGVVWYYNQFETYRYVILEVRDENGKSRTLKLLKRCARGYEVGDRIAFYNGLNYPIVTDTSQKEKIVCSCCGAINDKGDTACVDCRASFFEF